jgi:ATP-binding cassette subfamily A (ABC1) protein 3
MPHSTTEKRAPAEFGDEVNPNVSTFRQFGASLKKNAVQKFQSPVTCALEILLPVIFTAGIVGIWAAVGSETKDTKQFVNYDQPIANLSERLNTALCLTPEGYSLATEAGVSPVLALCPVGFPMRCIDEASREVPFRGLCIYGDPRSSLAYLRDYDNVRDVITIDEFLLMRWAWHVAGLVNIQGDYQTPQLSMSLHGLVRFAPDTDTTRRLIDYLNRTSAYFRFVYGGVFADEKGLEQYVVKKEAEEQGSTWAAIIVNRLDTTGMNVALRLNGTSISQTSSVVLEYYSGGLGGDEAFRQSYDHSGFLSLQKAISSYYITEIQRLPLPTTPAFAPMPYPKYTNWIFIQIGASQGTFALFMVLAYLYPTSQLVKNIVKEKEMRIREAMLIMGLGTGTFYAAWFVTYAAMYFIGSLIAAIIMKVTFFDKDDFFAIFFLLYLFALSIIPLAGILSTFFNRSRVAALVAPIVFFVLSIPLFIINGVSLGVRSIFLIISPSCVTEGFTLLANHQQAGGMQSKDVFSSRDEINMITVFVMLIVDMVFYSLLAIYFDTIIPSEWGTRKGCCFCFTDAIAWCRRKSRGGLRDDANTEDARDPNGHFEIEESNNANPVRVQAVGLVKEFQRGEETFLAVNNLHLHLRENEVSVLLGHNGAGKTTAINLLTSMLEIDKGDAIVYGKSVRHDNAAVRQMIGFCPQHNILWPELTCVQHLYFYAALKGVPRDEVETVADDMLRAVDLHEKRDEKSDNLSGGQKRKLSVAIAFIGGSKFVILDEPTAGMDVAARRFTWDLIKKMAPHRCVLLTTHYMDEADLLGDKISIMDKGRLRCEGSPMYLKHEYSVGYTVTLSVAHGVPHNDIINLFHSYIPEAKQQATGGEEMAFRVPMASAPKFPRLLAQLEDDGPQLGIRSYGITVTTLEDVFLRIVETSLDDNNEKRMLAGEPVNDPQINTPSMSDRNAIDIPKERRWTTRATEEERTKHRQFTALCWKRWHNLKRDRRTQCLQILLPVVCILLSMLLLLIQVFASQPALTLDSAMYQGKHIGNMRVDLANCNFTSAIAGIPGGYYRPIDVTGEITNVSNGVAAGLSQELLNTFFAHDDDRYFAIACDDARLQRSVLFQNYSSEHSYGESLNAYYIGTTARAGTSVPFTLINHPLPRTDREKAFANSIRTFLVAIVILIPFTFIPSTFVGWIVKEKECKAKHLQFASGANFFVYWLSNLVFDAASFLVTTALVIIIFLIFSRDEYVGDAETFFCCLILILLYGLAGATMAYVLGFFFVEHSTAQNVVMMGNFIFGFILVFMIFIFTIFESTKDAAKVLAFFFRVVPAFCLGEGLLNMATLDFTRTFGFDKSPFALDVAGWDLIYLGIEFPLFFAIALLLDHPARQKRQQQLLHQPDVIPDAIPDEDVDVARERQRVEDSPMTENDVVVVRHMHKRYHNGKVAVKNLSFGVKQGEVFGFLGTNGAGKTSTIAILCGELLPTHGRGFVMGHDVVTDAQLAQQHIGYCPQFDALLELLTAKEHLELYAGLRGVPAALTDTIAEELIEVCGLSDHKNTLAGAMSGGNKRKLSVAIALIGGPSVVFLDEPSAGMDPVARRGLWVVIEDIAQHSSVVLTTHHLEEIEALAHRVAIMVDGRLMCVGDKTHLKHKYGSGFEVQVRLTHSDRAAKFEQFVAEEMPTAELQEARGTKYTYALPSGTTKLSAVFGLLEANKEHLGIADYNVSATSIESVFLRISEAAEEGQEPDDNQQAQGLKAARTNNDNLPVRERDHFPVRAQQ